ncbi:Rad17-domain-containing protein [Heliocybe sulcata]|uniref:Rad17-domain-containing protein n=1 Tax=Heliocybe sulcata TaxID=5364 RepID=A0A5C3MZW2_9AGAM|nr:Rad17-domain-containing protein [Heliocybe sulcata]
MSRKSTTTRKRPANVLSQSARKLLEDDEPMPPPAKKFKPLSSALNMFNIDSPKSTQTATQRKGKGKEKAATPALPPTFSGSQTPGDESLWLDMYGPMDETDLAVHKRKVEDVRHWLSEASDGGSSGKLRKYRRLLVLSGPAGSAKTATIRVLSKELDFEILEWQNAVSEGLPSDEDSDGYANFEGAMDKFQAFAARAASCRTVFSSETSSSQTSQANGSQASSCKRRAQLILLEDLPNLNHGKTQERFHSILEGLVHSPASIPVVIVVSDAGIRGATGDDVALASGPSRKEAIGVRSVVPPDLWRSPYVTEIKFNPVSATLMKKALHSLVAKHSRTSSHPQPSKELVELVVDSANGDIRSAIMALQFACVRTEGKPKKKGRQHASQPLIAMVSRREQSLAMFHLLGKVLYNKRKGDAPAPSASAKDIQRDKELDATLKNPPRLPTHLEEHERKASRVDVEVLYADSPIDASLLSLYVHQNYTQFCNDLNQAEGVSDWLSWVDSNGGDQWYQTNPNSFHLITLGTLHSLPSPVPRRSQQMYKPEFFENLKMCRESEDAVEDVVQWLSGIAQTDQSGAGSTRWKKSEVVMELGPVLRARSDLHASGSCLPPPSSHRLFSNLTFSRGQGSKAQLAEEEVPPESSIMLDGDDSWDRRHSASSETRGGGWLEEDDIED